MLDTGFLQQLVVRLFTLSSSLQFTEASTASRHLAFHQLDPCSGEGKNLRRRLVNSDRGFLICPLPEPFWKVTSQYLEVLSCALSWLVNSSKWPVKVWNKIRFPALPHFCFSVQISKKSISFTHCTLKELSQSASVRRGLSLFFFFVFFFSWKNFSNKTRISVKITRKNIHKYMFTIYNVHLRKLFKKSLNKRLPVH